MYVDELMRWDMTNKPERVAARGEWWCHLLADEIDELLAFAEEMGLRSEWMHPHRLTWRSHFDLPPEGRAEAVRRGAIELDDRSLLEWIGCHRQLVVTSGSQTAGS